MTVKVYTKDDCGGCIATKKVLDKEGVKYDVINVENDQAAFNEMIEARGGRKSGEKLAMPFVDAGEHGKWAGFRIDKLKALAAIHE